MRSHPLLVAFVTLCTMGAALAFSATREPTYEASARVLVTPIPETERSLPQLPVVRASSDRTRVIQTAASLLDSPAAAVLTAQRLGAGWTAGRVDAAIDVLPEGESDILAVTAKASDGSVAARVADEFTRSALEVRRRALAPVVANRIAKLKRDRRAERDASSPFALGLAERLASLVALGAGEADPTFSVTQLAGVPESPIGASRTILVLVSIFVGFAVGIGAVLVIGMLDPPRVADAAQAVAATGLPVLARVPALTFWQRRRRSSPLKFRPAAGEALRMLQHQLELQPEAPRRLMLVGGSPGDGVTTSVAEFGLTLAAAGYEVLVVDLHPRKPELAARLGVAQPKALSALLAAGEQWENSVATVPGGWRLKLLAIGAQGSLGIPDDIAAVLPQVLAAARERFDYVLIDAPPLAASLEALRVASAVDAVVLVLRPGRTPLRDLEAAVEVLERARRVPQGLLLVGGLAPAPSAYPAPAPIDTERAPGAARVGESLEPDAGPIRWGGGARRAGG